MRCSSFAGIFVAAVLSATTARAQGPDAQAALWEGAIQGDTAAMAVALQQGAAIDSLDTRTNPNGRRALNWAAWYNRVPAIRFLLAHGASLEARNRTGFTALHHAAEAGSMDAVEALLAAGADPEAPNYLGRQPAETAISKGNVDVAAVLRARIRRTGSNEH
jgi:ankyrin repeat protein